MTPFVSVLPESRDLLLAAAPSHARLDLAGGAVLLVQLPLQPLLLLLHPRAPPLLRALRRHPARAPAAVRLAVAHQHRHLRTGIRQSRLS